MICEDSDDIRIRFDDFRVQLWKVGVFCHSVKILVMSEKRFMNFALMLWAASA